MTDTRKRLLALAGGAAAVAALVVGALGFSNAGATDFTDGPFHPGTVLKADLSGAEEVPGPGDPDGSGTARIELFRDLICFTVFTTNIDAITAAHIHDGPAGVAGPIVVPLHPVGANIVEGCVSTDLVSDITNNPEDFYVNVHNAEFPAGALRGQLHR